MTRATASQNPQYDSASLPRQWRARPMPSGRARISSEKALAELADFVERAAPTVRTHWLARLIPFRRRDKQPRFSVDRRDAIRINCEFHGAQILSRDHRCPYCANAETGEALVARYGLPIDYARYLNDPDID